MAVLQLSKTKELFLWHAAMKSPHERPRPSSTLVQGEPRLWQRPGAGLVFHGSSRGAPSSSLPPAHSRSTGRAGQGRAGGAGSFRKQAWRQRKHRALQAGQIFKHCPRTQQPKKIKKPTGYSPKPNIQNPLSTAVNIWTCTVVTQNTSFHENTSTLVCILNTKLTIPPVSSTAVWNLGIHPNRPIKHLPLLDFMLLDWWWKWAEETNM